MGNDGKEAIRLDKWLWAARFLQNTLPGRGRSRWCKIEINDDRAKPSRVVRIGDKLNVRRGPYEWTVIVRDISPLRDPAAHAQKLYKETEASPRKRAAAIAQLQLERSPEFETGGRPSKKDRRAITRFTKPGW